MARTHAHTHSEYWQAFVKGKMAAEDQLRNRYLISVEGMHVVEARRGPRALLPSDADA